MKRSFWILAAAATLAVAAGCSSGGDKDMVQPTPEQTQGGNVVKDPGLQGLTGPADSGGGNASTGLSGG